MPLQRGCIEARRDVTDSEYPTRARARHRPEYLAYWHPGDSSNAAYETGDGRWRNGWSRKNIREHCDE
jgi:hypothetical protein